MNGHAGWYANEAPDRPTPFHAEASLGRLHLCEDLAPVAPQGDKSSRDTDTVAFIVDGEPDDHDEMLSRHGPTK